jgi:uncharacterized membrane protein
MKMMYRLLFALSIISACTLPAEREAKEAMNKPDTTKIETNDINTAALDTSASISLPVAQKVKKPGGIYQAILPLDEKIEQTIVFNNDFTYKLQEKYISKKDSTIITEGNWSPSDGFIWLYKDQIVRGRYKWEGTTLQYFSPQLKKSFSMQSMQDAIQNAAWRNKGKEGITVFGLGNEPFWSIEASKADTISFLLSEWEHPLKMKINSFFSTNDSVGYIAQNDSVQIRVTVFPHFCNDGMSDFTYRNKIRVQYNHYVYNGCGIVYR